MLHSGLQWFCNIARKAAGGSVLLLPNDSSGKAGDARVSGVGGLEPASRGFEAYPALEQR